VTSNPSPTASPNTTNNTAPAATTAAPVSTAPKTATNPPNVTTAGAGGLSYNPYFYKVVILGEGGVGKSALTIMFVQNLFIHDYDPTIENSYKKQVEVDGRLVTIDILDTAGQEEYIAMRDQHIRRGQGFLIVYSIVQKSSYTGVNAIYTQIQRVKDDDHPPCVLVGNKKDLVDSRQVSTAEGQNLANSLGVQFVEVRFIVFSCRAPTRCLQIRLPEFCVC
jgi:small GTP-binding protein